MRKLILILAIVAGIAGAPPARAQQYTTGFFSSVNFNTQYPCGSTGSQTDQMKGVLYALKEYGGGTIDLTCYQGAAVDITSDIFTAATQNIVFYLGESAVTIHANSTIGSNFQICMGPGSSIAAAGGFTLTNNASPCLGGTPGTGVVEVNGVTIPPIANFNDTAPTASACSQNVLWQHSGTSISSDLLLNLGNDCTRVDVAALTPYTPSLDLYAATQTAITYCVAIPACKYDYSGYAGHNDLTMSQGLSWPTGSEVLAQSQTWNEPCGLSVYAPIEGALRGNTVGTGDNASFVIQKSCGSVDQTPTVAVYGGLNEVGFLSTGPTTQGSGQYPLVSVAAATATDGVTEAYFISGGSITGTIGQTCNVTTFNGGGSSATATATLVSNVTGGTLQLGQYFLMTAIGSSYASAPTTAVLSNGSASCSGTIQIWAGLGYSVYTFASTQSDFATNAGAGLLVNIRGFGKDGDYEHSYVYSSTSSNITVAGGAQNNHSPSGTPTMFGPFLAVAGGAGVSNLIAQPFTESFIHDLQLSSDAGLLMLDSGLNGYNTIGNITTGTTNSHEGIFLGPVTNSNSFYGEMYLGVGDVLSVGYPDCWGTALYLEFAQSNSFSGATLDLENVCHTIVLGDSTGNTLPSIYALSFAEYYGIPGQLYEPILFGNSYKNWIGCPSEGDWSVNDNVGSTNTYCAPDGRLIAPSGTDAGSIAKKFVSTTGDYAPWGSPVCAGTCATAYNYKIVYRDYNSMFSGSGCSVAPLGCTKAVAITTLTNAASLDSTHFNYLGIGVSDLNVPGVACFDVIKEISSTYKEIADCVLPTTNVQDQGQYDAGSTAYTQPPRDFSGDINTPGNVTASLFGTATTCAGVGTAGNPSVVSCAGAAAGSVYCDVLASGGTCTVNTTAVTTQSTITITPNSSKGSLLSETCNTALTFGTAPILAAQVAATSFTINMPTVVSNGACFDYWIIN